MKNVAVFSTINQPSQDACTTVEFSAVPLRVYSRHAGTITAVFRVLLRSALGYGTACLGAGVVLLPPGDTKKKTHTPFHALGNRLIRRDDRATNWPSHTVRRASPDYVLAARRNGSVSSGGFRTDRTCFSKPAGVMSSTQVHPIRSGTRVTTFLARARSKIHVRKNSETRSRKRNLHVAAQGVLVDLLCRPSSARASYTFEKIIRPNKCVAAIKTGA